MVRPLYTLLLYLLLPLVLLRLGYRGLRAPAYRRRIGERFGHSALAPAPGGIWVHAVSVGEVIAAAPLVRALAARYPGLDITLTTMTPTGSERVRALFGEQIAHAYAPYDFPFAWGRFLERVRPRLALVMETELWPNCVAACARRGIPLAVVNARLSARSARGYARLGPLTRNMLRRVALVAAQTETHGERFRALGLDPQRLSVTGSIKFDIQLSTELRERARVLREQWQTSPRPVWIAASTHEGEDEAMLAAHRHLRATFPSALLVLVPRHPERFERVARLVREADLGLVRRSLGEAPQADTAVLLGDTMGELLLLLGAADIAFVGGSLVARGGHNTLEPAAWGLPLLTGPSDYNFPEISHMLRAAQALEVVADGTALGGALERLVSDAALRRHRGEAAAAVVAANRGALARVLNALAPLLPPAQAQD